MKLIKFAIVSGTIHHRHVIFTKADGSRTQAGDRRKVIGIVAYRVPVLNREWSFRDRGGRERHHEALLFFAFSGVGVLLSMAPLAVVSSCPRSYGANGVMTMGEKTS